MPSYYPPKKNTEYIFYISLASQASTATFQSNPGIASGDFKVSKDGGALANLTTTPTVTPASSKMVKITLSATEMDADNVTVVGSDAAGAEWRDVVINLQTVANQIDDLATAISAVDDFVDTEIAAILTAVDTEVAAIKAKTDNLPASPAATGDIPSAASIADAVLDEAITEPSAVFAWGSATLRNIVGWLGALSRNRMTQTDTTSTLRNDADNADIATSAVSDDGTTFERNEWS